MAVVKSATTFSKYRGHMNDTLRILLIEDSEDDAKLVMRTLERGGYEANYFRIETQEQLIDALTQPWDAVISDFKLYGFSGLDALLICRSTYPDLAFILISGAIGEETAVNAVKAGANDYVMKENLSGLIPALKRSLQEAATRIELKKMELKLVESERRFNAFMDAGPLIASIKDKFGHYVYMNKGCEDSQNYESVDEQNLPYMPGQSRQKSDQEVLASGAVDETIEQHTDSAGVTTYRKKIRFPFLGSEGQMLLGSFSTDITKEKSADEKIRQLAYLDPLTNLPNRRLMSDRLTRAIARALRSKSHGALLLVDLDNFKTLNDTRGHDVGDQLLREVAQRLLICIRDNDTASRTGGDEFVIILESLGAQAVQAAATAEVIGRKILATLNYPFLLSGQEHRITASMGITLFCDNRLAPEELMKRADLAMYSVKETGRNALLFFDPAMQTKLKLRLALEAKIIDGLALERFEIYYQPQVDGEGMLTGVEALLRLNSDDGLVMPNIFIPLAEETGLVIDLGYWVIKKTCAQLSEWAKNPDTAQLTISVNVSSHQFRNAEFVPQILETIRHYEVNPQLLVLEITESLLLEEIDQAIEKMQILRQHGLLFSLDDFGTGYSSLYYLKHLPLQEIKIDRSFVRELPFDENGAAIVCAIIAMGNMLGISVIAEGVETSLQRDFLKQYDCNRFQGYLYGRPVPIEFLNTTTQSTIS